MPVRSTAEVRGYWDKRRHFQDRLFGPSKRAVYLALEEGFVLDSHVPPMQNREVSLGKTTIGSVETEMAPTF